jgi:hypothetical protein
MHNDVEQYAIFCSHFIFLSSANSQYSTQSFIRIPWDQTRFGNLNFSVFGMVVRGLRGQELSESIAQLISTNW